MFFSRDQDWIKTKQLYKLHKKKWFLLFVYFLQNVHHGVLGQNLFGLACVKADGEFAVF